MVVHIYSWLFYSDACLFYSEAQLLCSDACLFYNEYWLFSVMLGCFTVMLGWVMLPVNAQRAMAGKLITAEKVQKQPNQVSNAIMNETATSALLSIQQYFTAEAWLIVLEVRARKCQQ